MQNLHTSSDTGTMYAESPYMLVILLGQGKQNLYTSSKPGQGMQILHTSSNTGTRYAESAYVI
jgi:hypothetical protein